MKRRRTQLAMLLAAAMMALPMTAAPMSFGLIQVAPLLPEFLAAYPEISIDLHLSDAAVDLIGDGLTLLAGPSDPRWLRFATYIKPNAPLNVHVIDADTSEALGLQPTGALLARPDGRELARWTSADRSSR